jgi:regulatory protein
VAGGPRGRRAGGVTTPAPTAARALELAYRYLGRRERTVHELRSYLTGHDLEADAVEPAIRELIETGYLDDGRYARLFTEDKRRLEQWGSERIRRALLHRGIDADLVEVALRSDDSESGSAASELERAVGLLRQRFPVPPREHRDHRRALAVLVRRGYAPELALDAITAYSRGTV